MVLRYQAPVNPEKRTPQRTTVTSPYKFFRDLATKTGAGIHKFTQKLSGQEMKQGQFGFTGEKRTSIGQAFDLVVGAAIEGAFSQNGQGGKRQANFVFQQMVSNPEQTQEMYARSQQNPGVVAQEIQDLAATALPGETVPTGGMPAAPQAGVSIGDLDTWMQKIRDAEIPIRDVPQAVLDALLSQGYINLAEYNQFVAQAPGAQPTETQPGRVSPGPIQEPRPGQRRYTPEDILRLGLRR